MGAYRAQLTLVLIVTTTLAGCISTGPGDDDSRTEGLTDLEVYEYRYTGDDVAMPGLPYGFMARIANPTDAAITYAVVDEDERVASQRATDQGWAPGPATYARLDPGEHHLYLFQGTFEDPVNETGFRVVVDDGAAPGDLFDADRPKDQMGRFTRTLRWVEDGIQRVAADMHVATVTVGVWLNGTSFYTNIQGLNDDPAFPYSDSNRRSFDGTPLRVYVYDQESSEQPAGSKDSCHFVTIRGYNELLKTQAFTGTNVRWLSPEEAYTREGAEGHFLYGDPLVFLNTVVEVSGTVEAQDEVPDPSGDCFEPENASPVPLPV